MEWKTICLKQRSGTGRHTVRLRCDIGRARVNLTRFHGLFAPNNKHRRYVAPARRWRGSRHHESDNKTPEQRHKAIASIEDQAVIDKILQH